MYKITERKAGDFIDLESYATQMNSFNPESLTEEETILYYELAVKFFVLLILEREATDEDIKNGLSLKESEIPEIINQYAKEVIAIKESFEFIYNPPQLPSSTEVSQPTIGDEYRKEFAEMYGGYVNLILLICKTFPYTPEQCLQMRLQDFLFWGNLLMHRQFVENIK